MYDDELRPRSEIADLLRAARLADPEALATAYEELSTRVRETERLERRARKAEKELARLKGVQTQAKDLKRRLGSANASLDAYRAETARLKADLKRLRGSESYRIGRAVTRPVSMLRRGASPSAVFRGRASAVESAPSVSAPPEASGRKEKLGDYTLAELLVRFEQDHTAERLGHVLSRYWYQLGEITEPAALLRRHPGVVAQLDDHSALLADRIAGADRIDRQGISVPAMAEGAAYRVEHGRVLYCAYSTPAYNTNGYSVRTRGVASGLRSVGADVVVVARSGYPWDVAADVKHPSARRTVVELDGIPYVHLTGHALGRVPVDQYVLECADAFVREAKIHRPALIHAASNHVVGLAALIAARRLGLPFVYEVRGLWELTEASERENWDTTERFAQQVALETLVATEADAVLAITRQTRDELVLRGVPAERISLAPNAVDPTELMPLPKDLAYAKSVDLPVDVPIIGFAGSLVPYEGLDVLLDAAAQLRATGLEFRVAIAGSGSAESELRARAATLGIDDIVHFLGRVKAEAIPRLISLFDVMPCPRLSLPVTEMVSPLKPLEAFACAKAVVLSDVAPHLDLAGPDQARALLFRSGDATDLASVLRRLVDEPDTRRDLGRAGRLWTLDERSWAVIGADVVGVHASAAAAHAARTATVERRELSGLRIGLIADEFTTETLAASAEVVPLDRASWHTQLDGLDLVLVESAWKGNGGQWHRGVGYYSSEEHADLADLLREASDRGLPTAFWNKEDPIHFKRFVRTASLCDHVFTTDADKIVDYLRAGAGRVRSASALPFYAQPLIHNPLPGSRPFETTVSYAGTYYGDRYASRSAQLAEMLDAARPVGLAIYDRQAEDPDSPYRFPPHLIDSVRGSLPYTQVIDAYKAHVANLNVNSVTDSPSMFSRRVVEIAASGGVVLSGPGRGVDETFGSAIPTSGDPEVCRALLRGWANDPEARRREAWLQMRAVLRAHTVRTALTILARTCGLSVAGQALPDYAVVLSDAAAASAVAHQSVPPRIVWLADGCTLEDEDRAGLAARGIDVRTGPLDAAAVNLPRYVGMVDRPVLRTHFEDLLLSLDFGDWDRIEPVVDPAAGLEDPLAARISGADSLDGLVKTDILREAGTLEAALRAPTSRGVRLLWPTPRPSSALPTSRTPSARLGTTVALPDGGRGDLRGRTVLVAGHDLKFATRLLAELRGAGAEVLIDQWTSHTEHDEAESVRLLARADTVFCEWALGNAVWYSRHVRPSQRLVVRVHLQELDRPHLARIEHENVDAYVFVGTLIERASVLGHGVPADKCVVIPNMVDVDALDRPKLADAAHTLGLVGIVPQRKRLDLALDVLEGLRREDGRYRLRIKGKTPADYPWMSHRPDEMAYYEEQFERIKRINATQPGAVQFDGHGDDMADWYRSVGIALSVSDFESFHLTIADGAASGALPALLLWDGAECIYPRDWLSPTPAELVTRIVRTTPDTSAYRQFARQNFAAPAVAARLVELIRGDTHS